MNVIDKFLNTHPDWDIKDLARSLGLRTDVLSAVQNEMVDQQSAKNVLAYVTNMIQNVEKVDLPKFNHPIVIAPTVYKGGTGKSSSVINLTVSLAEMGFTVLLIDTDGQVDSTCSFLQGDEIPEGVSVYDAIMNMGDMRDYICRTKYDFIDIVPSSYRMMNIEQDLQSQPCKEQILQICLEGVLTENYYDFIIFDVNSMMSSFATAVWLSSNPIYLYSVIEPAPFAMKAIPPMLSKIEQIQKFNKGIHYLGLILNKVSERKNTFKNVMTALEAGVIAEVENKVFETFIHTDANIEKAQEESVPVRYYKKCRAVKEFDSIAKEIVERVCEHEE